MNVTNSFWMFIILCLGSVGNAQAQSLLIGQIFDKTTQQPIAGVNLIITGSTIGTTSDEEGRFALQIPQFPVEIRISHIAYQEQKLLIERSADFPKNIYLEAAISLLDEVVVSSDREARPLSNIRDCSVLDFTIVNDQLMWLEYYGSFTKRNLILADLKGQALDTLPLQKLRKIDKIHRSCTDAVYLETTSDAYRVDVDHSQLQLGSVIDVDSFKQLIVPCQLIQDGRVYYLFSRYNELLREVKSYDLSTAEVELLRVIADPKQIDNFRRDFGMIQRGKAREELKMDVRTWEENRRLRSLQSESHFREHVFYKPEFPIHLFAWEDKVLLANHPEKQIEVYQDNELEKTIAIEYPSDKHWLKRLIRDQKTQKLYALFKYKGGTLLKRVNLDDGTVGEGYIVDAATHQTIEVWNDEVFYLKKMPHQQNRSALIRETLYRKETKE